MPPIDGLTLRDRLLALRRSTLARLATGNQLDSGLLRLAADSGAVLAQLEDDAVPAAPGDRALVVDDNMQIQVVVYSADRQAACATLSPAAAIRLGNRLVAAGARRL